MELGGSVPSSEAFDARLQAGHDCTNALFRCAFSGFSLMAVAAALRGVKGALRAVSRATARHGLSGLSGPRAS